LETYLLFSQGVDDLTLALDVRAGDVLTADRVRALCLPGSVQSVAIRFAGLDKKQCARL
jgi:hypothetical protein